MHELFLENISPELAGEKFRAEPQKSSLNPKQGKNFGLKGAIRIWQRYFSLPLKVLAGGNDDAAN